MFKDLHASPFSLGDEDLVPRGIVDWLEGTYVHDEVPRRTVG